MSDLDKRRHQRIDSLNLSYVCTDGNAPVVRQSMGRTLNVSESGICLETHFELVAGMNLTLGIAFENHVIDLEGRVVYCRPGKGGRYESGVEFYEISREDYEVLRRFIEAFQRHRDDAP